MRAFFLVLTLLLILLPRTTCAEPDAVATAEAKTQAQRFFQAGVSLQKTEDFEAAIAAYETSLQLFATKSALFNLANCQRAAHRYADAWNSLQRLQSEFGSELVEPMSSTSRAQLEELENLTGLITVETRPSGATVTIDGKPAGVTPWTAPRRVTIGQHSVEAALPGYVPKNNTVRVTPKQALAVVLELDAVAASPTPAPTAPAEPTPPPPNAAAPATGAPPPPTRTEPLAAGPSPAWRTVGWVGMAVGALGIAAGARVGLLALDVDERLREACEAGHCARSFGSDVERLERLTLSANVFIGAGVVLLGTGATLVLWPSASDSPERLELSLSPNALRIGGTF